MKQQNGLIEVDWSSNMVPHPRLDEWVLNIISLDGIEELCQIHGVEIDYLQEARLSQGDHAIVSPLSRRDVNLNGKTIEGSGDSSNLPYAPMLDSPAESESPVIIFDGRLWWTDGPYTTHEGGEFQVTGDGYASLLDYATGKSLSRYELETIATWSNHCRIRIAQDLA